MKHARSDYDAIQPWPTKRPHTVKVDGVTRNYDDIEDWEAPSSIEPLIPDDEPVFLIRSQDVSAIPAIVAWCENAKTQGVDPEIIAAVRRHIDLMHEWRATHPVKVADVPPGVLR